MSVEQTARRRVADNYRRAPQKGQYVKAAPRQMTIFVAAAGLKEASLLPATPAAGGERSNVSLRVMVLIKYSAIFNTPCLHVHSAAAPLSAGGISEGRLALETDSN